MLSRRGNVM